MPKYLVIWNIGYGPNEEVIEADDDEKAQEAAYNLAREEFEASADYKALLLTPKVAEEYGIELDDPHASFVDADEE